MKSAVLLAALSLSAIIFCFPVKAMTQSREVLSIVGATTVQPVIEALAGDYKIKTGQEIMVQGGGSRAGIEDASRGMSHLGMVSRALFPEERAELEYKTIGLDALVYIVNERNPMMSISREAIIELFTGQIQNWNGLSDWDRTVVLVSKELGRSTLDLFEVHTGVHHRSNPGGENGHISEKAYEIASNLDGATLVGGVPGAMGYLSLGISKHLQDRGMPIKILELEGFSMDQKSIISGEYPITRELNLVYRKENEELVRDFIDFCLGPKGQQVIRELGFITVKEYR